MRMLMIGMDGVKAETFERGWTPFIQSLIKNGNNLELKEDLISRGWAEIVLGQHASATKAVYEGPRADGTHIWTDKYKLSDTPGLGDTVKPIWQVLNERGYKVGVMNVPTTFPAPSVDGFFVSGGGGGGPIGQDVTPGQCYPQSIQGELAASGYIVDERGPSLLNEKKLYNPGDFYYQLNLMNEKRTDSFIKLSKSFKIDFGFLVFKSSPVTTETFFLPELERCQKNGIKSEFYEATETFYRDFDKQVKRLVESFPSAQIILVSDHSMAVRKYSVNANAFLVEIGMQVASGRRSTTYSAIKSIKHFIPTPIRKILKKNSKIKSSYESMTTFDVKLSKAFSISFSQGQHGIFINDTDRFNGPVPAEKIESYKAEIVNSFNAHSVSLKFGLKAYSIEGKKVAQFPDVVLDLPDGFLTSSENKQFVSLYRPKVREYNLREAVKGRYHTIKAHRPLAINCTCDWNVLPCPTKADLRLIYDHILNEFSDTSVRL